MSDSPDHRRLLGQFLRRHRERLSAADLGLVRIGGRQRTPGLRREEVAQICGVSPTWYTWIEQGRGISVSPAALGRIAEALQLTPPGRAYLFELARKRDPRQGLETDPAAASATVLQRMLDSIAGPAYLLDRLWRPRAWNAAAAQLFAAWLDRADPCSLLEFTLLAPEARTFLPDWEARASRLIAEFRADTTRIAEDDALRATVERLHAASPLFAARWRDQTVLARLGGERLFDHPGRGRLRYDQVTLWPAGLPGCKLVMLVEACPSPLAGERGREAG